MPVFFPHAPSAVRELLEFLTDVRMARDGEMRDSLRPAVQSLDLAFQMLPAEGARLNARLRSAPTGEWYLPLWSEATFLAAGISAGAGSVSVETDADYRAGGLAVIFESETSWELVEVASAAGGTLTFAGSPAGPVASFSGPVIVAPVGTFVCVEGAQRGREFARETARAVFRRVDLGDPAASSLATYLTHPVLDAGSVVVSPLDASVRQAVDLIDSGFGTFAVETRESYVRERFTVSFADVTHAARWARKQLLHYLRGRDRAFWLPTFRFDFPVVAATSTTLLRTSSVDWPSPVSDLVGRHIRLESGSTVIYRSIAAASVVSGELRLTLNSSPGTTIALGSRVSLMALVRLDADVIELAHEWLGTDFLTRVQIPTVEVPA